MNQQLFQVDPSSSEIFLVYSAEKSAMPAKELGEAIIGLETCLKEAAKIGMLAYDNIYVLPIENGSVRTKLIYVQKHPWQTVERISYVATIIVSAFVIIDRFGSNSLKNPTKELLDAISDKKVFELCRSYDFRKGAEKMARPVSEYNEHAEIVIGDKSFKITCDNKYQFYVDKQEDPILPELRNGEEVVIDGEITRINKKLNDLGFIYKGYTLNVSPLDKEKSTTKFHEYLEMEKVQLRGIVIRNSDYEVPKIKVVDIESYKEPQQKLQLEDH